MTLLFAFCVIYVAADFRYPLPTPFPGDCRPVDSCPVEFTPDGLCPGERRTGRLVGAQPTALLARCCIGCAWIAQLLAPWGDP